MLDPKLIREEPDLIKGGLQKRGLDPRLVDSFLKLDNRWRKLTTQINEARAKQRQLEHARQISQAKKIKTVIGRLEKRLSSLSKKKEKALEDLPNVPAAAVPKGGEDHNKVICIVGKKPRFHFKSKDHLALGEELDIIDLKHAALASGSRFAYLKGGAALLELGLIQYTFDKLLQVGFQPTFPPALVKPEIMKEMGKGKFIEEEEAFYLEKDDLYLIGSAEHTLGALGKNRIFSLKELPKKYAGFSTSFRREAGSYGKDTKGILRVHQFDKIEQFVFCHPKKSEEELKKLVATQEKLIKGLKLPYRIVEIAAGDMTWGDYHQFDIEVWLPSQRKYRELGSASNTTDFQARGVNARFRDHDNQLQYVHMLNATALAMGRTIAAIMENYQTAKGKIKIPMALQKYLKISQIQ